MRLFPILLLSLSLGVGGCASNEKIQAARHLQGTSCCRSYQDLPYSDLLNAKTVRVEIDIDAPVFDFPEGASRFAAFRLPEAGQTGYIRLKTTIVGIYMPDAFVFFPAVTLLDAGYRRIQFVEPELRFERVFLAPTESQGWVADVRIPPSARYVLIHTPSAKVGTKLHYQEGVTTPSGSVVPAGKLVLFMPGNWWDVYLPAAGAGRFEIELRGAE